jgi:hypothetical protein
MSGYFIQQAGEVVAYQHMKGRTTLRGGCIAPLTACLEGCTLSGQTPGEPVKSPRKSMYIRIRDELPSHLLPSRQCLQRRITRYPALQPKRPQTRSRVSFLHFSALLSHLPHKVRQSRRRDWHSRQG